MRALLRLRAERGAALFANGNGETAIGDGSHAKRRHGRMTDLQKFQRACRVFLARPLATFGPAAPDLLRRIADELEWLEQEGLNGDL